MICWAPWFSQVHRTGLLSVFLKHSLMYLWWYYFLICFVSYSWLMRTLSYSKWVQKKLTKDKTELNHNIQWCPLTNLLQSFIHNYDNTIRQYHKQQLTRASQCFRKTKIQSSGASFVSFWQSKQKWHHFRAWWKMTINNLSFITTLRLQSVTLELGSIERIMLTCCLRPPFPCLFQCWPQIKLETIPPKNHYKTTLEERKTGIRAVWPKLSVLDCSLSHRSSLAISEWNCFLYLHELGRAKHRYPARRGFSPAWLLWFY